MIYPKKPILVLQNNLSTVQPVTLFTNAPNASGAINASTSYAWNVTSQDLTGLTNVQLQVKPQGTAGYATLTTPIAAGSIASVVAALNTLNIGFFYLIVSGGNTYIQSSNAQFVFGSLTINQNQPPAQWITTGQISTSNLQVDFMQMYATCQRSSVILSSSNSSGVPPIAPAPFVYDIVYSFAQLRDGDTIIASTASTTSLPVSITYQLIVKENGVQIFNDISTPPPDTGVTYPGFTFHEGSTYDFTCTLT